MTGDLARALKTFNALCSTTFATPPASLQAVCTALQPSLANLLVLAQPLANTDKARYLLLLQSLSQVLGYIQTNYPTS